MDSPEVPQLDPEALAWLHSIFHHGKSTPRDSLFSYFRGQTRQSDLTLPIVNLVSTACKTVFPAAIITISSSTSDAAGDSVSATQLQALDCHACVAYLYYIVAEHALQQLFPRHPPSTGSAAAAARFKGLLRADNPPGCSELVALEEFHMPLVECALQLVHHVVVQAAPPPHDATSSRWLHVAAALRREDRGALLWQASSTFLDCFCPASQHPLPGTLAAHLSGLQAELLSGPVLQTGSVFFQLIQPGRSTQNLLGGTFLAEKLVVAYADQAVRQAQLVAWHLQQQQQQQSSAARGPQLPPDFHQQAAWLMDRVVLRHLELCFGVAMSVVVAGAVYLAAKVLQPGTVNFAALTEAMKACLPAAALRLGEPIELAHEPLVQGDLRAFYNDRFLPAVRPFVHAHLQDYSAHASMAAPPPLAAATAVKPCGNWQQQQQHGSLAGGAAATGSGKGLPAASPLQPLSVNIAAASREQVPAKHKSAGAPCRAAADIMSVTAPGRGTNLQQGGLDKENQPAAPWQQAQGPGWAGQAGWGLVPVAGAPQGAQRGAAAGGQQHHHYR